MRMRLLSTLAVVLGCFGLTACGQKGDLYLPPESAIGGQGGVATSARVEIPAPLTLY